MMRIATRRRRLAGMFLLEALVALVVFSLGMLGLLGLLAGTLRASGSAQWRAEGFDIAAAAVARMWSETPAALAARYATADGAGYREVLAQALRLPGVTADSNVPRITLTDTAEGRHVEVLVQWQAPADRSAHRASVSAVLPHP